jgi:perosamine synthetase
MRKASLTRRQFLATASAGTIAAISGAIPASANVIKKAGTPAILGGSPVRSKPFPDWPVWDKADEESVLAVLRSGIWWRGGGKFVSEFEKKYAELMGAKRCVAVVNGTNALLASLYLLGAGPGDEVIVPPYTFVATISAVLLSNALPVFADTDPDTFQINPDKIEQKITEHTRAIIPVHILGGVANMDKINAVAEKHNLKVIEDACQSHLAEWRNKKVGTVGDLGCFSFQNSKHLPCGEGGAILGDDEEIMDRCQAFHNSGRPYRNVKGQGYPVVGSNIRMMEYQGAILLGQMKRIEEDAKRRTENAAYLTSKIRDIPGIVPQKFYEGATRNAYHLYAFRYKKEHFNNLPRGKFLSALRAEGIPCSGGYSPLNKEGTIEDALNSRSFQKVFSKDRLDKYREQNHCPENDRLCEEAVWFTQNLLLGTKSDMDDITDAISKIYENRGKLV